MKASFQEYEHHSVDRKSGDGDENIYTTIDANALDLSGRCVGLNPEAKSTTFLASNGFIRYVLKQMILRRSLRTPQATI